MPRKNGSKGGRSPKAKGDNYERELATYLNAQLFGGDEQVRRAPLSGGGRSFAGGGGQADLTGTPGLWVEAKRCERMLPREWIEQAERGRSAVRSDETPVVITRRNLEQTGASLVILRLDDFVDLYRAALMQCGHRVFAPDVDDPSLSAE